MKWSTIRPPIALFLVILRKKLVHSWKDQKKKTPTRFSSVKFLSFPSLFSPLYPFFLPASFTRKILPVALSELTSTRSLAEKKSFQFSLSSALYLPHSIRNCPIQDLEVQVARTSAFQPSLSFLSTDLTNPFATLSHLITPTKQSIKLECPLLVPSSALGNLATYMFAALDSSNFGLKIPLPHLFFPAFYILLLDWNTQWPSLR